MENFPAYIFFTVGSDLSILHMNFTCLYFLIHDDVIQVIKIRGSYIGLNVFSDGA